jgi:hypothetical protein
VSDKGYAFANIDAKETSFRTQSSSLYANHTFSNSIFPLPYGLFRFGRDWSIQYRGVEQNKDPGAMQQRPPAER